MLGTLLILLRGTTNSEPNENAIRRQSRSATTGIALKISNLNNYCIPMVCHTRTTTSPRVLRSAQPWALPVSWDTRYRLNFVDSCALSPGSIAAPKKWPPLRLPPEHCHDCPEPQWPLAWHYVKYTDACLWSAAWQLYLLWEPLGLPKPYLPRLATQDTRPGLSTWNMSAKTLALTTRQVPADSRKLTYTLDLLNRYVMVGVCYIRNEHTCVNLLPWGFFPGLASLNTFTSFLPFTIPYRPFLIPL